MDSAGPPLPPTSATLRSRKRSYATSVSSGSSSSSDSPASSPVFSVRPDSSQGSAVSSIASTSLEIGWDGDSQSHAYAACPDAARETSLHVPPQAPTFRPSIQLSSAGAAVTGAPPPRPTCSPSFSKPECAPVPPSLRQNRRRTSRPGPAVCPRPPPTLVRQSDRKGCFVDNLVDAATQIVEVIWPLANIVCRNATTLGGRGVLPLKTFIQETLRRSHASYSTLQVALFYLVKIKHRVPSFDFTMEQPEDTAAVRALQCGRRMFLSALILAAKYLQDRNYSARAWSKISGLTTHEINQNEMTFLGAINYRLHVPEAVFKRWTDVILENASKTNPARPSLPPASFSSPCAGTSLTSTVAPGLPTLPSSSSTSPDSSPSSFAPFEAKQVDWSLVIGSLTPELVRRSPSPALVRA